MHGVRLGLLCLAAEATFSSWALPAPAAHTVSFTYGKPVPSSAVKAPFKLLTFKIAKMHCATCAKTYVTALSLTAGIKFVSIELQPAGFKNTKSRDSGGARATVVYDTRLTSRTEILDRLHQFHFQENGVKEK